MLRRKIILALSTVFIVFSTTFAFHSTQSFYKSFVQGEAHFKRAEYEKAASYFTRALTIAPQNASASRYLAWSYQKLGMKKEALAALQELAGTRTHDPIVLRELADAYYGLDEYAQAEGYYRRILKRSWRQRIAKSLAEVLAWQGKYEQAVPFLEKYLRKDSHDTEALELLGDLYLWSGDYPKATAMYARLSGRSGGKAGLAFRMAEALRLSGKDNEAIGIYRDFLQSPEGTLDQAGPGLAESLGRLGKFDEAVAILRRMREDAPDNKGIALRLAYFLEKNTEFSEAREVYSQLLKNEPDNRLLKLKIADLSLALADYAAAQQYYRELLGLSPGDMLLRLRLADAYFSQGDYAEAARLYAEGGVEPFQRERFKNFCYALLRLRRTAEAIEAYRRYLKPYPADLTARLGLAQALYESGATGQAEGMLGEMALEAGQDDRMLSKIAEAALGWHKQGLAEKIYEDIIAEDPLNKNALLWLARIKSWNQDYHASLGLYERIIVHDPDWIVPRREKARVLGWMRRYKRSIEEYKKIVSRFGGEGAVAFEMRAKAHYYRGFFAQAIEAYREWLEIEPDDPEALFDLAQIYSTQMRWEEAIRTYEQILVHEPAHSLSRRALDKARFLQNAKVLGAGFEFFEADSASRQADMRSRSIMNSFGFPLSGMLSAGVGQKETWYGFSGLSSVFRSSSSFVLAYNQRPHLRFAIDYSYNNYSDGLKKSNSYAERLDFSPAGGIAFGASHGRRDVIENARTLRERLRADDYALQAKIAPCRRLSASLDAHYSDYNDGNHRVGYGIRVSSQLLYEPRSLELFYGFRQYGFNRANEAYFSPGSFHTNSVGLEWRQYLNARELFWGADNPYYTLRYEVNLDVHNQHGHVLYADLCRDWNGHFSTSLYWQKIIYEHVDNYSQDLVGLQAKYYF
ncbi:MAG: tetratricopeptide repeat protein [Candidatus Omnitrophica bacterium]|nr:tetratricopeptide repeat protein [Candidatus Omnitrophota bacterium]